MIASQWPRRPAWATEAAVARVEERIAATRSRAAVLEPVEVRSVEEIECFEFREFQEGARYDALPIRTVAHQGDYWLDITDALRSAQAAHQVPALLTAIKHLFVTARRAKRGAPPAPPALIQRAERRRRR